MPRIQSLFLRCCNPQAQRRFYSDVLGMKIFDDGSVGYGGEQASIHFLDAQKPYDPQPNDLYWKIALAVPNIELACQQLSENGIQAGAPRQFQDVGFLAHFTDPEGFVIELIEHWFEGNRPKDQLNLGQLGGGAHFNLLTLRTTDIDRTREVCSNLNMAELCIQPVKQYGFTLYFFAFTSDVPPSSDLYHVENREWLYQRPYTILEVQHVHATKIILQSASDQAGFAGTGFSGLSSEFQDSELQINMRT